MKYRPSITCAVLLKTTTNLQATPVPAADIHSSRPKGQPEVQVPVPVAMGEVTRLLCALRYLTRVKDIATEIQEQDTLEQLSGARVLGYLTQQMRKNTTDSSVDGTGRRFGWVNRNLNTARSIKANQQGLDGGYGESNESTPSQDNGSADDTQAAQADGVQKVPSEFSGKISEDEVSELPELEQAGWWPEGQEEAKEVEMTTLPSKSNDKGGDDDDSKEAERDDKKPDDVNDDEDETGGGYETPEVSEAVDRGMLSPIAGIRHIARSPGPERAGRMGSRLSMQTQMFSHVAEGGGELPVLRSVPEELFRSLVRPLRWGQECSRFGFLDEHCLSAHMEVDHTKTEAGSQSELLRLSEYERTQYMRLNTLLARLADMQAQEQSGLGARETEAVNTCTGILAHLRDLEQNPATWHRGGFLNKVDNYLAVLLFRRPMAADKGKAFQARFTQAGAKGGDVQLHVQTSEEDAEAIVPHVAAAKEGYLALMWKALMALVIMTLILFGVAGMWYVWHFDARSSYTSATALAAEEHGARAADRARAFAQQASTYASLLSAGLATAKAVGERSLAATNSTEAAAADRSYALLGHLR